VPRLFPSGYQRLTVQRAVPDASWGRDQTVSGGGLVRSNETGLDASGRRTRLSCRLASVDKTGKTPFQSDPLGACTVYFPPKQVITLEEIPDFRSRTVGWESTGATVVEPACEHTSLPLFHFCLTRSQKIELVVRRTSLIRAGFALKRYTLTVHNTDPAFGLVEDHDQLQVSSLQLLCGDVQAPQINECAANYEYGTKVVLDAQWDITRSLTVSWDGCDPPPAGSPPTSDQICPVTMTGKREITIYWH
jgi:hypothetical protein